MYIYVYTYICIYICRYNNNENYSNVASITIKTTNPTNTQLGFAS